MDANIESTWVWGVGLAFAMFVVSAGADEDTQRLALGDSLRDKLGVHSNGEGPGAFKMPRSDDYASIVQDPNNPVTIEKVRLGRFLFHETAVATEGTDADRIETWSCASCHHVAAGFKSGLAQGIGDGGTGFGLDGSSRQLGSGLDAMAPAGDRLLPDLQPLTSPAVLNTAFQDLMLWNGSFGNVPGGVNAGLATVNGAGPGEIKANTFGLSGLETQALAGTNVHRLRFDSGSVLQIESEYRYLYANAYPDGDTGFIPDNGTIVTPQALGAAKAIAAYERTIMSNLAPFQRWLGGAPDAMTVQQLRGANLFFGKAECVACHTGPALSSWPGATAEQMFFAVGFNDFDTSLPRIHGIVDDATSRGRGGFTGDPADDYKFKVPQLYNLTDSSVFGHGASFSSVRDIVEYKNEAIAQNPFAQSQLSERFRPLQLSETEIDDLVVFLEQALYDRWLDRYVPSRLPSDNCFPVADVQSALEIGCVADANNNGSNWRDQAICEFASSDPDGDGWGWEDQSSCLVLPGFTAAANDSDTHPPCQSANSDSDGDGWGWENERSCRVAP